MQTFILIALAAAVARFIVGAIWYMPKGLFGKRWLALQGVSPESAPKGSKGYSSMAIGFLITFISTFILGIFVVSYVTFWQSALVALLLWAGFILPCMVQRKIYDINNAYPWGLFWIDSTYELVGLIAAVAVFGWLI